MCIAIYSKLELYTMQASLHVQARYTIKYNTVELPNVIFLVIQHPNYIDFYPRGTVRINVTSSFKWDGHNYCRWLPCVECNWNLEIIKLSFYSRLLYSTLAFVNSAVRFKTVPLNQSYKERSDNGMSLYRVVVTLQSRDSTDNLRNR